MINIQDKSLCCGCGACSQVCPKHCITMIQDNEGFFYPKVDVTNCIDCKLCEKSCPILNTKNAVQSKQDTFVGFLSDENIRMRSSSGGLFSALCKSVLNNGGAVFGAAFDSDFLVHHICIHNEAELPLLYGSKYLQSRIEDTYVEAKAVLEEGHAVLFSGTGCQIAGLKSYLKKDYPQLYTVDILCHGVPSPKLWKHYLAEQERSHGAAVRRTFFRQKNFGWKTYVLSLEFSNDNAYVLIFKEDPYMQMFLRNICLRPSCHDCKFKASYSQADITLGDAWGIEKYMPEMDDDKGCSLILIHTEKGQKLLQEIQENLIIAEADLSKIQQPMISQSAAPHPHRERFFKELGKGASIQELLKLLEFSYAERAVRKVKRCLRI